MPRVLNEWAAHISRPFEKELHRRLCSHSLVTSFYSEMQPGTVGSPFRECTKSLNFLTTPWRWSDRLSHRAHQNIAADLKFVFRTQNCCSDEQGTRTHCDTLLSSVLLLGLSRYRPPSILRERGPATLRSLPTTSPPQSVSCIPRYLHPSMLQFIHSLSSAFSPLPTIFVVSLLSVFMRPSICLANLYCA